MSSEEESDTNLTTGVHYREQKTLEDWYMRDWDAMIRDLGENVRFFLLPLHCKQCFYSLIGKLSGICNVSL